MSKLTDISGEGNNQGKKDEELNLGLYKKEITQGILGFLILNLLILSPSADLTTWLTIGLGSILVLLVEIYRVMRLFNVPTNHQIFLASIKIISSLLMNIGLFAGNFNAPFVIIIPYSYYFLLSAMIVIILVLAVIELFGLRAEI